MFRIKKYSLLLTVAAALLCFASCSIKEDRTECPCWLTINYDAIIHMFDYKQALVTIVASEVVCQENVDILPLEGVGNEYAVPRRENIVSCVVGHENLWWKSDSLTVPEGLDWGKVFLDSKYVDCSGDLAYTAVNVHKEYCQVNFILVGLNDASLYPFDIRVRGNNNGIRLRDRRPLHGRFTTYAQPENTAELFRARIPRQEANELTADLLYRRPDHDYAESDLVMTMNLGTALESVGYNWNKEDLDDLYVTVDFVLGTFSVSIMPWASNDIEVRY